MIDNRLNKESRPIGIIGFYECTNDNILSKLLIEKAINYLKSKECRLIRGPINLTIWHQYRFVLDQREEDTFSLEPITKNYYPEQFINAGFKIVCEYCSGIRRDFSTILPYTLENYKYLLKEGFSIRKLTKNNFKSGLFSINKMSNKIFKDSWSFVELSEAEFLYLYEKNKNKLNTQSVEIVSDPRGKDVGFCFSIKDPRIEKTFIVKSIGVLSEYRKKGVGATLIYNNHEKMAGEGMNTAIYALIKIGNNVTNMNYPGIKIIRKYIVLEKEII
jgi:GNAT superfamily N-acetyltransferase